MLFKTVDKLRQLKDRRNLKEILQQYILITKYVLGLDNLALLATYNVDCKSTKANIWTQNLFKNL